MQEEGSDPFLTAHAERRGVQRNIPDALQEMVLKHADWRTYRPGGLKVALITRRKLERMADKVALDLRERLEGVHVLYNPCTNAIVTAFRETDPRARRYRRT